MDYYDCHGVQEGHSPCPRIHDHRVEVLSLKHQDMRLRTTFPQEPLSMKAHWPQSPLSVYSLEPMGYHDMEEGGEDLIRYAVHDHGRRGVYSVDAENPLIKEYRIYGLYYVGAGRSMGYPGKYAVELGYRMELMNMEVM